MPTALFSFYSRTRCRPRNTYYPALNKNAGLMIRILYMCMRLFERCVLISKKGKGTQKPMAVQSNAVCSTRLGNVASVRARINLRNGGRS